MDHAVVIIPASQQFFIALLNMCCLCVKRKLSAPFIHVQMHMDASTIL